MFSPFSSSSSSAAAASTAHHVNEFEFLSYDVGQEIIYMMNRSSNNNFDFLTSSLLLQFDLTSAMNYQEKLFFNYVTSTRPFQPVEGCVFLPLPESEHFKDCFLLFYEDYWYCDLVNRCVLFRTDLSLFDLVGLLYGHRCSMTALTTLRRLNDPIIGPGIFTYDFNKYDLITLNEGKRFTLSPGENKWKPCSE